MIDDNDIDSQINDLTIQAAALHISEKDMFDPIEILAKKKRLDHEEMEFPDEVNTLIHIRAKDKFGNYRGATNNTGNYTSGNGNTLKTNKNSRISGGIDSGKKSKIKVSNLAPNGGNNDANISDNELEDSTTGDRYGGTQGACFFVLIEQKQQEKNISREKVVSSDRYVIECINFVL